MKISTILSALVLMSPVCMFAADIESAKRDIYNPDIHIADNARMDLQQLGAERELLAAFRKETSPRRDIFSRKVEERSCL